MTFYRTQLPFYPPIENLSLESREGFYPVSYHRSDDEKSDSPPASGGGAPYLPTLPAYTSASQQASHFQRQGQFGNIAIPPPHSAQTIPYAGSQSDFGQRFDPRYAEHYSQYGSPIPQMPIGERQLYPGIRSGTSYSRDPHSSPEDYFSDSPFSSPSSPTEYNPHSPLTIDPRELHSDEPAIERFLRREIGFAPNVPVSLNSLSNPRPGARPAYKLRHLVELAIWDSRNKKLALQEIYQALEARFAWFRENPDAKWKGSIRHLLSLQGIFRGEHRPLNEPGKGQYWTLDIVTNPYGLKRDRKRRSKTQPAQAKEDDDDYEYSGHSEDEELERGVSNMQVFPRTSYAPPANLASQYGMHQRGMQTWTPAVSGSQPTRQSTYPQPSPQLASSSSLRQQTSFTQMPGHYSKEESISPTPQHTRMPYHSASSPGLMALASSASPSMQVVPPSQLNYPKSEPIPGAIPRGLQPYTGPISSASAAAAAAAARHQTQAIKQEDEDVLSTSKPLRRSTRERKTRDRT